MIDVPAVPIRGPWSLSQLSKYKQCPTAYDLRHNKKLPDPSGPAASRGTDIHAQLESYLETGIWGGNIKPFTRQKAEQMRIQGHKPEAQIALDTDWKLVEWKDPRAWVRGIIDTLRLTFPVAAMGEWKTGKIYEEDHARQRRLYLTLLLSAYSDIEEATIETIYADQDHAQQSSLVRSALAAEQQYWRDEAGPMLRDTFFSPRPGPYCSWCNYGRRRGGPCPY
jgi:hypothetical protein